MQPAEFKAVPFDETWINHDKIDVHAIYRRPILDDLGEQKLDAHGVPQWDYTGGLPVRRHLDWVKKGFQYVTLADGKSLSNKLVVAGLAAKGLRHTDFIMWRTRTIPATPWNPALYLASQSQHDRVQSDQLRTMVERLGSQAVLDVSRNFNPLFELPVHLRDIPPGGTVKVPAPAKTTTLTPEVLRTMAERLPQAAAAAPEPRAAKKSMVGRQRKKAARNRPAAPAPDLPKPRNAAMAEAEAKVPA